MTYKISFNLDLGTENIGNSVRYNTEITDDKELPSVLIHYTRAALAHCLELIDKGAQAAVLTALGGDVDIPHDGMYGARHPKWNQLQQVHLGSNPLCRCCNTRDGVVPHHIVPVHLAPSLELDQSNLISMCGKCHLLIGHLGDWRSWNPGVRQDCEMFNRKIKIRPYGLEETEGQVTSNVVS